MHWFSFSSTGQQPTGSSPLLWEKQDADAKVRAFPLLLFVCTCLLCIYTCPCILLACCSGRWLQNTWLSAFPHSINQQWRGPEKVRQQQAARVGVLSVSKCCYSPARQNLKIISDFKSQLVVLSHIWLPWDWEPWAAIVAALEWCEQPDCSLSWNLPYLTADHIPISHVSGQQLLVSILLMGGNTITSMEVDTAAGSKGKITAFVPPGCMLPSCSVLWFVSVFWFCCCGLSFWSLSS